MKFAMGRDFLSYQKFEKEMEQGIYSRLKRTEFIEIE
jgi:hypothetical protein